MKPSNACRLLSDNWKIVQFDFNKGLEAGAYKKNFYNAESLNARIPQTVPSILFANGKIADPYFADNVLTLDWIEKKEWWFYTDIIINRKPGRKYSIFFEGINYRAEIWFNSVQIGILEGMFNSSEFSIPEEIIAKGQNRLSLRLRSQENSWEDQPARDISRGTIRTQGTVAQFSYYWNWAPHLIPIGIWRPVYLREKSYASLGSLDASTGISSNLKTGNVNIKCSIIYNTHSFFAGKKNKSSRRVILCGDLKNPSGKIVCSKAVNINIPAAGSGIKNCRLKISVKNPKLWWPNGYGDQPLYKLEIKLAESGGKPIESTGRSMAFREIKLIRNTDSAAVQALSGQSNRMWSIKGDPYPWTLVVNKKRIFAKGVNIVPFDSMYNFTSERYRRILELARDSHLIVLRVWGGGITENDEFYDLCDKYGLLVWQEFYLACGTYPAINHDLFLECAAGEIRRLKHHASLYLWAAGNEFNPDLDENKPLIDKLEALVNTLDHRPFHRGSPYRGDRHGGLLMLPNRTSNKYSDVLPGEKRIVLFRSEVAVTRSPGSLRNFSRFLPKQAMWPIDRRLFSIHHAVMPEWDLLSGLYGPAKNLREAVLLGQIEHAQNNRYNMEFCRSRKYRVSGCLTWQMNVSWPAFHRELTDYYGTPKPAYYYYKRASSPAAAFIDLEKFIFRPGEKFQPAVFICNDLYRQKKFKFTYEIIDRRGNILQAENLPVVIGADSTVKPLVPLWRIPEHMAEDVFLVALSLTENKKTVYNSIYWFGVSPDVMRCDYEITGSALFVYRGKKTGGTLPFLQKAPDIHDLSGSNINKIPEAREVIIEKEIKVPSELSGHQLEIHIPEVYGNIAVYINGKITGKNSVKKNENNGPSGDPVRYPVYRHVRFSVPQNLHEFTLRFRLFGHKTLGLPSQIFLRPKITDKEASKTREYFSRADYFLPLRREKAVIEAKIKNIGKNKYLITACNTGKIPACFICLETINIPGEAVYFSDNAFSLFPGRQTEILLKTEDRKPPPEIEITGLNIKSFTIRYGK